MKKLLWLIAVVSGLGLTGCGQVPLKYQATLPNLEAIKVANPVPVNVGNFALEAGKPSGMDIYVKARGYEVKSPINNSFSAYLKDALMQELRAAGKFDPNSTVVISGMLTKNELDASIGTGKGAVGASFEVTRDGNRVYFKQLEEKAEWPSAFVGADAIPTAINQYASLYKKLIGQLFADEDFKRATQPR